MATNLSGPVLLACVCLVLGCGGGADHSGAPTLTLLDSVLLQESDTLFVGRPEVTFAVDDSGYYYVPDVAADRLLSFDRSGRRQMTYGHEGDGPGEIRNIFPGVAVVDSIVLQASGHMLHAFDRWSGQFLFRVPINGAISQISRRDSILGVAAFDPSTRSGLLLLSQSALWTLGTHGPSEAISSHLASWPGQYRTYPALLTYYSSNVVPNGTGWLLGFAGVPDLVLYSATGAPLDTVRVPWRSRTGNAPSRYEMLWDPSDQPAVVAAVSALTEMGAANGGRVIVIHQDYRVVDLNRPVPFESRAWVSLLSSGLDSACVDAELPFPGSHWPRMTIRGDTVYALDQAVQAGDSLASATVVRRYLVGDAGCRWLDT